MKYIEWYGKLKRPHLCMKLKVSFICLYKCKWGGQMCAGSWYKNVFVHVLYIF